MAGLCSVTVFGHLGRDADLSVKGGQPLCKFSVAVTTKRSDQQSTAWYACSLWGARAEKLAQYLTKGKAVLVTGELVPREYRGKQDELRTSLDINVQSIQMLGGGAGEERGQQPQPNSAPAPHPSYDDSEVPF